jgi:uncharacterized tellurite resistance protein B-like protein
MLKALTELIDQAFGAKTAESDGDERRRSVEFATALLLVEVARADYDEDPVERRELIKQLDQHFELTRQEIELLVEEAESEADDTASLQEFTRRLHEALTLEEKFTIVEMLWRVAQADDHLDKHEDHLVRKIAGLLYIPHKDLIRIRNRVLKRFD